MKTTPINNKFGKPTPYPISFGVYKATKRTFYGYKDFGVLKDYKLDIYTAQKDGIIKHKLYYLSDGFGNWIKSKLVIFDKGDKQIIRSEKR